MKSDVLLAAAGGMPPKRPSKETLNHPGIVALASGLDPFRETGRAYLRAYEALGIDIVNRVPLEAAPAPLAPGEVVDLGNGYRATPLGVYGTVCRHRYPFRDADEFWAAKDFDLDYHKLMVPVPHALDLAGIRRREEALGDRGLYYYMYYTTFFMWGVEYLGWEVFMTAGMTDPEGFAEKFLEPAFQASLGYIEELCKADIPFVFLHDDLADARGPVFPPSWYDAYILPRYPELFAPIKKAGKKVIFVADGNMAHFLRPLRDLGVDGVMLENPATDFGLILEAFSDGIIIGGADTKLLTFGSPEDIRCQVREVAAMTREVPGFALSSPGGLHGNIPLENLEAYFDARFEAGFTPPDWRAAHRRDNEKTPLREAADFVTSVRLMDKQNQFKVELKAPEPTRMEVLRDRIVFSGNPEKQDNSFLQGKARLEIARDSIREVRFSKFFSSAIKLSYFDGEPKTVFIQYLADNLLNPYDIRKTRRIYEILSEFRNI
jgi:hypothetical protein